MYAIIRKLVLVVGSKSVVYNINVHSHDLSSRSVNHIILCRTDTISTVMAGAMPDLVGSVIRFDITKCHPEYICDMLLCRKGNLNAVIRSLFLNADAVWLNKDEVYKASAEYIKTHKGRCDTIPCYACPFSYLEHDDTCYNKGFVQVSSTPVMEDTILEANASSYLEGTFNPSK